MEQNFDCLEIDIIIIRLVVCLLFIIPPANEVARVYSGLYVRPSVRSFVRPSPPNL